MKLLLTLTQQDFEPDAPVVDRTGHYEREAARAVLLDSDGGVFLLNVSEHHYHKLPGGGIDAGETKEHALRRELLEEVGCEAEIISEIGVVVEYRDFARMIQTSYCYLARQCGEVKNVALGDDELADGIRGAKAESIDQAVRLLEHDTPINQEGLFNQRRELVLLREARDLLLISENGRTIKT